MFTKIFFTVFVLSWIGLGWYMYKIERWDNFNKKQDDSGGMNIGPFKLNIIDRISILLAVIGFNGTIISMVWEFPNF